MNEQQPNDNFEQPDEKPDLGTDNTAAKSRSNGVGRKIGSLLSGDILVGSKSRYRYPLLLYCAFLVLLYIMYVFNYQHVQRQVLIERERLSSIWSRKTVQESIRLQLSSHSVVVEEVKRRGLDIDEFTEPPMTLE